VYNSLLEELLSMVSEKYKQTYPPADRGEAMESTAEYIKKHYADSLTTNQLCKIAALSPSHFCRCFKKHFGCTVSDYVIKCRLEAACAMMENTSMQIGEIAAAVGYSSESFFRSSFKKQYGITPTQYRNSFIQNLNAAAKSASQS